MFIFTVPLNIKLFVLHEDSVNVNPKGSSWMRKTVSSSVPKIKEIGWLLLHVSETVYPQNCVLISKWSWLK